MQQLNDFFQNNSDNVLLHLKQAANLSELVQVAITELNGIIGQKSEFGAGLTVREQRLVNYFFNSMINTLYLLDKVEIKVETSPIEKVVHVKKDHLNDTESTLAVVASTLGAVLTPGGFTLSLLGGLATGGIAVFVTKQIGGNEKVSEANGIAEQSVSVNSFNLSLNSDEIQSCLKASIENFDKITGEIEEIRKEALQANLARPIGLEEMPNILPFLHEMLSFQQNSELPKELQDYLPIVQRILHGYKIDVVQYQPGINDDMFDRQSAFGEKIEEPIMLKPALIKEGKLLLNGVILCAS